jgi:hypothetical protein
MDKGQIRNEIVVGTLFEGMGDFFFLFFSSP